jgi:hypothetical protein
MMRLGVLYLQTIGRERVLITLEDRRHAVMEPIRRWEDHGISLLM